MTERPHYRTTNHLRSTKVTFIFNNEGTSTPQDRWQEQYNFTPETNMGRVALGCGTEKFEDFPPIADDPMQFVLKDWPESEFPQD